MKAFMYDVVNMIVDRADDESATIPKQIPNKKLMEENAVLLDVV